MPALNGDQMPAESPNWGRPGFGPNPKENTQGMLFSNAHAVNKASKAAARTGDEVGHKGYSQNRLTSVRRRMPVETYLSTNEAGRAITTRHGGQVNLENVTSEDAEIAKRMTSAHIHDTVARSTMPLEHLQALHPSTTLRTLDMGTAAGSFNRQTNTINLHAPLLHDENPFGADTVLHELGHAVDAAHSNWAWGEETPSPGRTANVMPMSSPEAAAIGEGFADAYALKHSRGRGGAEPPERSMPYEKYSQQQWESYSGHQTPDSSGDAAPTAYREALALHTGRGPKTHQLMLGEGSGDMADIWNGGAALVRKKA